MHMHRVKTTPSRRLSLGSRLAFGHLFAFGLAVAAASAVPARAVPGASTDVSSLAPGSAKTIALFVGRSEHVTLPWPAKGASVTDPAVADIQILTPEILLVTGKAIGTTNILAWSEDGKTMEAKVEVNSDLSRLKGELTALYPHCNLQVTQTQSAVVLAGSLERADQVESIHRYLDAQGVKYVDMTSVAGVQQVQVQVRMAEVSRSAMRALGVNGLVNGSDAFGGTNLDGGNVLGGPANQPAAPSVTVFAGLTNGDLRLFIKAMAENKYLHVLAEPNLVALSGSEASFLVGGEVPIPVAQGGGGGTTTGAISIEYKTFGITLTFRPTVIGDGAIRLEVFSEVSEIDPSSGTTIQGITTPGFLTRRAQSTLELNSGQTFAMAGLLSEKTTAVTMRLPVLGNLPILGALFRSVQYQKGQTELLLLVTANLVEPVSTLSTPPLPGDLHVDPSDWELYVDGRSEGKVPARIPPEDAEWMREMGLDRLKGPGAWMTYGQPPAASTARSSQRAAAPSGSVPPVEKP